METRGLWCRERLESHDDQKSVAIGATGTTDAGRGVEVDGMKASHRCGTFFA